MKQQDETQMPDFKQLNDRVIAPPSKGPFLRIRTNLDEATEHIENKTSIQSD